jgi:flagellar hook-associated protein 1 FlgK
MSLVGALHLGRSGLTASQSALQVVGNNLSNAATVGYSRQSAVIVPGAEVQLGADAFVGTGARLQSIIRHVDQALIARVRASQSDTSAAQTRQELLTQIESIHAELSDNGLSNRLNEFFSAWEDLANNPSDAGLQALTVSQGRSLAEYINSMHGDLVTLRTQVDDSITSTVNAANDLLDRIALLNRQIVITDAGTGAVNGLRDERDRLIDELSELVDVQTIEQSTGAVDVLVNSLPVVLAGQSRGLEAEFRTENDELQVLVRIAADGSQIEPSAGKIAALLQSRETDVVNAIETLNTFAGTLAFEVNKIHASGQAKVGFTTLTSTGRVEDSAASLNSVAANLPFTPVTGTLAVHLTQKSTGQRTTTQIGIDLNGIGSDTTLNDLAAAFNGVANLSASVSADGKLSLTANGSDFEFSFSDDTSGVLAALGLNTYFAGSDASNLTINANLAASPQFIATGQGHIAGDNRTALAIAGLADDPIASLGTASLEQFWKSHVEDYAIRTAGSTSQAQASQLVTEGLAAQRLAVSGVNVDEEAINMLAFQRAFQGSARFIGVIDELMNTMLSLV